MKVAIGTAGGTGGPAGLAVSAREATPGLEPAVAGAVGDEDLAGLEAERVADQVVHERVDFEIDRAWNGRDEVDVQRAHEMRRDAAFGDLDIVPDLAGDVGVFRQPGIQARAIGEIGDDDRAYHLARRVDDRRADMHMARRAVAVDGGEVRLAVLHASVKCVGIGGVVGENEKLHVIAACC